MFTRGLDKFIIILKKWTEASLPHCSASKTTVVSMVANINMSQCGVPTVYNMWYFCCQSLSLWLTCIYIIVDVFHNDSFMVYIWLWEYEIFPGKTRLPTVKKKMRRNTDVSGQNGCNRTGGWEKRERGPRRTEVLSTCREKHPSLCLHASVTQLIYNTAEPAQSHQHWAKRYFH